MLAQLFFADLSFTFLAIVGLIVLAIVAVAARPDHDASGQRAYAIYLFLVTFVALFVTLAAVHQTLQGIGAAAAPGYDEPYTDLTGLSPTGSFGQPSFDAGRRGAARTALEGALVAGVGVLLLRFHGKRALDLLGDDPSVPSGLRRSYEVYLYGTLFALAFALAGTAIAAGRALLQAVGGTSLGFAPERTEVGVRDLVVNALFAAILAVVFKFHW